MTQLDDNLSIRDNLDNGTMLSVSFNRSKMRIYNYNYESKSFELADTTINKNAFSRIFSADFSFNKNLAYLSVGLEDNSESKVEIIKFRFDSNDIRYDHLGNVITIIGVLDQVLNFGWYNINRLRNPRFKFHFNTSEPLPPLSIDNSPYAILDIEDASSANYKILYQFVLNSFGGFFKVLKSSDVSKFFSLWEDILVKINKPKNTFDNFNELKNFWGKNEDSVNNHFYSPVRNYEINDYPDYIPFPHPVKSRTIESTRNLFSEISNLFQNETVELAGWNKIIRNSLIGKDTSFPDELEEDFGENLKATYYINDIDQINISVDKTIIFKYGLICNTSTSSCDKLFIECSGGFWDYLTFLALNILNKSNKITVCFEELSDYWEGSYEFNFSSFKYRAIYYQKKREDPSFILCFEKRHGF